MPLTPETIAAKPYNQCISCDKRGVICDGPNVISMSVERFCEWCRDFKEFRGWSNAKLSEVSRVSKTTVDRVVSGRITGLNCETISALTCALVYGSVPEGDSWGKYPCPLAIGVSAESPAEKLQQDYELLLRQSEAQAKSDREKIDYLKQQIAVKDDQLKTRDHHLEQRANFIYRKDRVITVLAALLGVSVLLILAALTVDMFNPNIGFFWMEQMATLVG